MIYLLITAGVFLLDYGIKRHVDAKYARNVKQPHFHDRLIIEKYYNKGAALNFLAKKPGLLKFLHTALMLAVGIYYYFLLKTPGQKLGKTGVALLAGGGLSNLFDRYKKGHVVDYFRINAGPTWLRRIIFNISDFCIFIGMLLAALGGGEGNGGV